MHFKADKIVDVVNENFHRMHSTFALAGNIMRQGQNLAIAGMRRIAPTLAKAAASDFSSNEASAIDGMKPVTR
jgi:hypothetical protein